MFMKRVLIVSTVSRQFYLFEQTNIGILKELGYEVHGAANFLDVNERLDKVDIIRHPIEIQRNPFSLRNITAYRQLKKLMKEYAFNLVHCHSPVGACLARLAARATGIKNVIYTAHGFHFFKGAPLINWLLFYPIERWLSRYTDTLITINREDYKRARNFKTCKVKYVPGIGIDTAAFDNTMFNKMTISKEMGIDDGDIVIVSVGELNKTKNHEIIIKALTAEKSHKIKYVLCGTGSKEHELKALVEKKGLGSRVIFMGYQNDIRRILSVADIFVQPSFREGLPVALMEAMSSGLPVVCSCVRGNVDLIKNTQGGFLVHPDDVDGFRKAISRLAADKALRIRFGSFNKEAVRKNDKQYIYTKMKEIYLGYEKKNNCNRRIAFVIGSMGYGGAERVISFLANSYADSDWQVTILLLLHNQCDYKLRDNIRLIDFCNENKPRILYLPIWIYKIRKYIKENRPDKVVSFIGRINVITLMAGIGLDIDIIVSERSNPNRDGRTFPVKIATHITYTMAKTIIFQTKAARNCFPSYLRSKSVIIPNPVHIQTEALHKKNKKIVTAGRLSAEKNHKMLINAFQKIKAEHPDYCLYIYGEGVLRNELEKQVKELCLESSVFLPGNVDNLHEQMADAEIFVLSSNYEGQSNALVEAMMMGIPCISTRYDGVTELIKNGKNGILVNPGDDEQLCRKLNILIEDKNKAMYIGHQGQISVEHMRLKNCLPVWKSIIED